MERIDLFDRYIKGELSEAEKIEFKDRLKSDDEFTSEFRIYSLCVVGICKEAQQDDADLGIAMKHLTKEQLLAIIGRNRAPIFVEDLVEQLRVGYTGSRARAADVSCAAALGVTDDDDYIEYEQTKASRKDKEKNRDTASDSMCSYTLIFIIIVIFLILLSILLTVF